MESEMNFETTAIIDLDEQIRKEEELMNTIKMEPILEKVVMDEEPNVVKKQKRMRATDYFLVSLIFILSIAFVIVLVQIR